MINSKVWNSFYKGNKKGKYCFYILGCLIIFAFNVRNIRDLITPNILFDEFGYLSTGAFFADRNWSDIVSNFVPYYSYGYGFIISLVMRCAATTKMVYQVLIICNAIMICATFVLSDYVCSSFIDDIGLRKMICFVTCFYPSIIHNTQFAWTETLLAFLFFVVLSLFKCLIYRPNVVKSGLFGILIVYLYAVHQRSIGVLGVSVLIMMIMTGTKVINKKCLLSFSLVLLIAMFMHYGIKEYTQNNLWMSSSITEQEKNTIGNEKEDEHTDFLSVNDYGGQIEKVKYIFTSNGFICFLAGIWGKIYYFGIATFFLGFEGIYYLANLVIKSVKKYRVSTETTDKKVYIALFVLLSFGATMLISAVFHIYPVRIDTVIYGRYTDWMVIFFAALGVYHICLKEFPIKRLCYYVGTSLIFLCYFNLFIEQYDLWSNFATCSPITFLFRNDLCNCEVKWVMVMFLAMILFSVVIWALLSSKRKVSVLGLITMMLIWIGITMPAIEYDITMGKQKELIDVVGLINKEGYDNTIYYVIENTDPSIYVGGLQYLLDIRNIEVINAERLMTIEEGIIVFEKESSYMDLLGESFIKLGGNELFDIYCVV